MCEFDGGDLEIAKVWVETVRRAAKAHRCSSCWATIGRGDAYLEVVSILDSVWRERMCFLCWWAREDFHQEHGGPRTMPSGLESFLDECVLGDEESQARWGPYLVALRERSEAARA